MPKPKLRFRIGSLLLLIFIVSVPLAHFSWHRSAQIAEARFLKTLADKNYHAGFLDSGSAGSDKRFDLAWAPCGLPAWLCRASGVRNHHIILLEIGEISSEEAAEIAKLPYLQALTVRYDITKVEGILSRLRKLRYLCLHGTNTTKNTIQLLENMAELRELRLGHTAIGDEAIVALARLKQLKGLDINGTQLTESGRAELRRLLPDCQVRD